MEDAQEVPADNAFLGPAPGSPVLPLANNSGLAHLTLDNDDGIFLSKICQVLTNDDGQAVVHWVLKYCFDQFVSLGEQRKLNKWCRWFEETVVNSNLWSHIDPAVIFRLKTDASKEDSLASTKALLSFFSFMPRHLQLVAEVRTGKRMSSGGLKDCANGLSVRMFRISWTWLVRTNHVWR